MINNINAYSNINLIKAYYHKNAQKKTQQPLENNNYTASYSTQENPVKASIFYINDVHGQNIRMERLVNAINQFDTKNSPNTDKMKFASGDIMLGEDEKNVKVADKFLNIGGFYATALGNHECDLPTENFVNLIKDKQYKILG